MLEIIAILLVFLIVYHHVGYPVVLKVARKLAGPGVQPADCPDSALPYIDVLMPAHNEAAVIARKVANLASLDYPADKLRVTIVCDGSTDNTAELAEDAIRDAAATDRMVVIRQRPNIGKIAVLNRYIPELGGEIVALTDVSAEIAPDAFRRAAAHFTHDDVGVVAATYKLAHVGHAGEQAYWRYQTAVKLGEAALGAPLGVHGALYFVRRKTVAPLPADTINDDFILPMRIVADGFRAIYDPAIVALELECADLDMDQNRRKRIAAGNLQQLLRMPYLLSPRLGGVAFAFASGKALRAVMPFLIIAFVVAAMQLAPTSALWAAVLGLTILGISAVTWRHFARSVRASKLLDWAYYAAFGHFNGLIGASRYLLGFERSGWKRATQQKETKVMTGQNLNTRVAAVKRGFDIFAACVGLTFGLVLFPLIALAIKLDSPGPVLFKQLRVGRSWPHMTELFWMYKFRSMRTDAETKSGPVWAAKRDPRITRVGQFLRKSRLDEIPQLINVLKGEMSIIGPRPERPGFFNKLEAAIPFYAERTWGVRPGITGLAQVFQGYDETIEDVRSKVSFDHAYAASLWSVSGWARMDAEIVVRTLGVMVGLRGQ